MGPRLNLRRCARRSLQLGAVSAQYTECALFNDSTGPDLLYVRGIFVGYSNDYPPAVFTINGLQGANPVRGVPIVTGEASIPGQVTDFATATVPPFDFFIAPVFTQNSSMWFPEYPIAVLQPGWSLVVAMIDVNEGFYAGFYWQAIHAEDLDGRHCPVCDVNITIAP